MNEHTQLNHDDVVERAMTELLNVPVPEGPSPEAVSRTLAALEAAGPQSMRPSPRTRFIGITMKTIVAAAIAAIVYAGFIATQSGSVAFADVAAKIRAARSFTYEVSVESPGAAAPMRWKTLYLAPNRSRVEMPSGVIRISDLSSGESLTLHTQQKLAFLTNMKSTAPGKEPPGSPPYENMVESFRTLADKRGEPLGEKEFGGVKLRGFRVHEGEECVVWADPKTGDPVRVEMSIILLGKKTPLVFDHFVLDAKLDEALFKIQPPEGYTIQKLELKNDNSVPSEKDVIDLLRGYAGRSEGRFPKLLDDWGDFAVLSSKDNTTGKLDDAAKQLTQSAGRVMVFLQMHKKDGDFGYTPKDVKLGDAEKIVFWYRPEDSKRFRAVYGDLKVADVDAGQLPQSPK